MRSLKRTGKSRSGSRGTSDGVSEATDNDLEVLAVRSDLITHTIVNNFLIWKFATEFIQTYVRSTTTSRVVVVTIKIKSINIIPFLCVTSRIVTELLLRIAFF